MLYLQNQRLWLVHSPLTRHYLWISLSEEGQWPCHTRIPLKKRRTNVWEGISSWVTQQIQTFAPFKLCSAVGDFRAPQKHWAGVTRDISQTLNLLFLPKMPLVTIIIQASTSVFLIYLYLTWYCIICQEGNIILHCKWIGKKNVFTMSWIVDGFLCQSWHLEV